MAKAVEDLITPKSRRRRTELLAAAQTSFEKLGYFNTRVADIVELAGVSQGTFYTYFDSKDDVLHTLVDAMVDDLLAKSSGAIAPEETPFLALKATIRQFMHAYRDHASMVRVLEEAVHGSAEFLKLRQDIRARFGRRLERVLRGQAPAADGVRLDPVLGAYALGGMVDDFARGCYILEQRVDERAAINTLAVIWARAIGLPIVEPKAVRRPTAAKATRKAPARRATKN